MNYTTTHYTPIVRFRERWWRRLWARRPQIFAVRSEHFTLKLKRWWDRSDRDCARLSLALLERERSEHMKAIERMMFFGGPT